jgi:replicative DNA helicase
MIELQFLNIVLRNPKAIDGLPDILPEHFSDSHLRALFAELLSMRIEGVEITTGTVARRIEGEWVQGAIANVIGAKPDSSAGTLSAEIINLHQKRTIENAGNQIAAVARDERFGNQAAVSAVEILQAATNGIQRKTLQSIASASNAALVAAKSQEQTLLIKTGIEVLDRNTGGAPRGLLTIVAGRPGSGKSAFMINCAINMALSGNGVFYASLEDSANFTMFRVFSRLSGVGYLKLARGEKLSFEDVQKLEKANDRLAKLPMHIDDGTGQTPASIRRTAQMLSSAGKLDCVYVDYLGELVDDSDAYGSASTMVKQIRDIGRDLEVPVILGCQLSRKPEERKGDKKKGIPDHVPQLSDLRDSGKIEQVARNVWLMYREAYYNPDADATRMDVIVAKATHGTVGKVTIDVDLPHMAIGGREQQHEGEQNEY